MTTAAVCQLLDGRIVDIRNPEPSWFDIRTVAWSLSSKNRFGGMATARYSVAEHCLRLSRLTSDPILATYGILHELDEVCALPDVPSGLKYVPEMAWYRALCDRHQAAGHAAFGLQWPRPPSVESWVKAADAIMLATERRDLMAPSEWKPEAEPLPEKIVPMSPDVAEREFLARWGYLQALRRVA